MQCTASTPALDGNHPYATVRGDGLTEKVGDLILTCTGGTSTANGNAVPTVDIRVTFNAPVTSRLVSPGYLEALLIFDRAHERDIDHVNLASIPIFPCGATGTNDNGSGICPITSTGDSTQTYNGTAGHPNAFQGRLDGANTILFQTVPIDAIGVSGSRILRFMNLRVNASQIGVSQTQTPNTITATVAVTGAGLSVPGTATTLAKILNSYTIPVNPTPASLTACSAANGNAAADHNQPLQAGGQNGQQFTIAITEPFESAWVEKNIKWHLSSTQTTFTNPGADGAQDTPNGYYWSESGLEVNGLTLGNVFPPPGYGPFVNPVQTAFPATHGLVSSGTANTGTRIVLKFTSVNGLTIFVPTTVALKNGSTQTGLAILVATDANGAGAFSVVAGNGSGLAALSGSGTVTATYEIVFNNPYVIETISVPVAAAFAAGQPTGGEVDVQVAMAPVSTVTIPADTNTPQPRFEVTVNSRAAFLIQPCSADLTIGLSHVGSFNPNDTGKQYTMIVGNAGTGGSVGTVTVTNTLPAGFHATAFSGTGWTCTILSSPVSCSRNDSLAAGATFPPLTLTVSIDAIGGGQVTDSATVSGGADINGGNNSVNDITNVGGACTVTLSTTAKVLSAGGTFSANVVTAGGCTWNVSSNTPWITVPASAGTGSGNFNFTVAQNTGDERIGVITSSGASLSITQHGAYASNAALVRQYYRDLLAREPDQSGLDFWIGEINANHYTRPSLGAQFFTSPEFSQRGLFVIKTYNAVLGRMPDYAGFRFWVGQLAGGVQPIDMVTQFIGSPEFTQRFGNPDNAGFITLMYQNVLGRNPDSDGLAYWKGQLDTNSQTRTQVMYAFIISPEFDNLLRNKAYALLLYMGFLARAPDLDGYNYWVGVLSGGTALSDVIVSFVFSPEYQGRF